MSPTRLILWLWHDYLKPWRWWFAGALVLMSLEGSMTGLLSYLVKPLFDSAFSGATFGSVLLISLAVSGTFIVRAMAGFAQRLVMTRIGENVVAALQGDVLRHLLTLDQSFFKTHPPGALIERTRGDSAGVRIISNQILVTFGRDLVSLVTLVSVAVSIDWRWTLVAVAGVPLIIIPVMRLQQRVRASTRKVREAAAIGATRLDEIFHGVSTVQLTGTEARESDRYRKAQRRYIRAQLRSEAASAGIPALIDVVSAIGFAGVLIYGGIEIMNGNKTIGEFMAFFTAMALIFEPLRRLGNISGAWQTARASLDRVVALMAIAPQVTTPAQPKPLPAPPFEVVFDRVSFGYGDTPVLHELSFTAAAGRTTAIVGPSGAGKTTLFALLARMVDVQSGRVTLGGTDVRDLDLGELRRCFSIVSQETALFDETIRDNVTMGQKEVAADRLANAISAAHLTDFVAGLPDGLDTPAGPRGSALSGGQRQRVAIARALLRDAPVLLLDEATSALDATSEAAVQEALERLSAGRTTLVIAHRLATVRNADKIVVVVAGRVVEEGTHDELVARDGVYAGLSRLQFTE